MVFIAQYARASNITIINVNKFNMYQTEKLSLKTIYTLNHKIDENSIGEDLIGQSA